MGNGIWVDSAFGPPRAEARAAGRGPQHLHRAARASGRNQASQSHALQCLHVSARHAAAPCTCPAATGAAQRTLGVFVFSCASRPWRVPPCCLVQRLCTGMRSSVWLMAVCLKRGGGHGSQVASGRVHGASRARAASQLLTPNHCDPQSSPLNYDLADHQAGEEHARRSLLSNLTSRRPARKASPSAAPPVIRHSPRPAGAQHRHHRAHHHRWADVPRDLHLRSQWRGSGRCGPALLGLGRAQPQLLLAASMLSQQQQTRDPCGHGSPCVAATRAVGVTGDPVAAFRASAGLSAQLLLFPDSLRQQEREVEDAAAKGPQLPKVRAARSARHTAWLRHEAQAHARRGR